MKWHGFVKCHDCCLEHKEDYASWNALASKCNSRPNALNCLTNTLNYNHPALCMNACAKKNLYGFEIDGTIFGSIKFLNRTRMVDFL